MKRISKRNCMTSTMSSWLRNGKTNRSLHPTRRRTTERHRFGFRTLDSQVISSLSSYGDDYLLKVRVIMKNRSAQALPPWPRRSVFRLMRPAPTTNSHLVRIIAPLATVGRNKTRPDMSKDRLQKAGFAGCCCMDPHKSCSGRMRKNPQAFVSTGPPTALRRWRVRSFAVFPHLRADLA